MRLPTKPKQLPTTTPSLFMRRLTWRVVAITAVEVLADRGRFRPAA
jgi:hypothetical protein